MRNPTDFRQISWTDRKGNNSYLVLKIVDAYGNESSVLLGDPALTFLC